MLAFPSMLTSAAKNADMAVPDNPDNYNPDEFPHFHVFCNMQLGVAMTAGAHWENAKVIAQIPEENLRTVTAGEILDMGWVN